ncbi:two-component system response regulator [Sulfurimonas sp. SAG-AH-194-I05]|nr:two-component system response regulator [Sulfurimonas sp. SAG-AH-194-I05]MDF1875960.1 two-component system response regulator [Sulfurimonas sp. SAG-AH-194-I05]
MKKKLKTILVVDDTPANVDVLIEVLENDYDVIPTLSGEKALEIAFKLDIDLILLDIMMPEMDGYEVSEKLKSNLKTNDIPIIFITAMHDEENIVKAYDVGGVDYITKPFRVKEVISRVAMHLNLADQKNTLKSMKEILEVQNISLEMNMQEQFNTIQNLNTEIEETQREIIYLMSEVGEKRSQETGNHVKRVANYSKILATLCNMSPHDIDLLYTASPMHDIGKVGIPDGILNKPGKLTPQEFEVMKQHSAIGYSILEHSNRKILKSARIISYQHHEKWDGTGYPQGLKGKDIHIFGRITAIADVFDALGSDRVYKRAWELDKILELFKKEKAKHFDPELIDLFFQNLDKFLEIRDKYKDV